MKPEFVFSNAAPNEIATKATRAVAHSLGYDFASTGKFQSRALTFQPGECQLVFTLGRVGSVYRGIKAAVLVFVGSDGNAVSVTDDIFQVNYKDKQPVVAYRLRKWLDAGLTRALEMWRAQI